MTQENDLSAFRAQIAQVDEKLLYCVAERQALVKQVADLKRAQHLPIKDYGVEKNVLENMRRQAKSRGISPEMAEELMKTLIQYSCQIQEKRLGDSYAKLPKCRKEISIIGGLGQMGQWLSRFFESLGHAVNACDLKNLSQTSDVIILATPISVTAGILEELIDLKPKGLVFDICSLKSPLITSIKNAQKAGLKITSVHPMFGPSAEWLAGRNILICDAGNEIANSEAHALFEESSANLLLLPLEKHDPLMGYVLGLSHLTNLVFAASLEKSGVDFEWLQKVGGTTFNSQLQVTEPVLSENQALYFEIQSENKHTPEVFQRMKDALEDYARVVENKDEAGFKQLMEKGRTYLTTRKTMIAPAL